MSKTKADRPEKLPTTPRQYRRWLRRRAPEHLQVIRQLVAGMGGQLGTIETRVDQLLAIAQRPRPDNTDRCALYVGNQAHDGHVWYGWDGAEAVNFPIWCDGLAPTLREAAR